MKISRVHILLLAIISITTGVIAPSITNENVALPYSFTNLQYASHALIISMGFLFLVACLQWKKLSHIFSAIAIVCIVSLFTLTITGLVKNFSGTIFQHLTWGWYFLGIGLFLLFVSLLKDNFSHSNFFQKYGIIIGILGLIAIGSLSAFLINISHKQSFQGHPKSTLSKVFQKNIITQDAITTTQAFDNIQFFHVDRSSDFIAFLGTKNGQSILYPFNTIIEDVENIENIRFIKNEAYIILKNGIITKNQEILGTIFPEIAQNEFLAYKDLNNHLHIISAKERFTFPIRQENIHQIFVDIANRDVFWRADSADGQAIFKNGIQVSGDYPSILRYAIAPDGTMMCVTENESRDTKFVLKNEVVIHTISDQYIRGSLQMNGTDVIYMTKDEDDKINVVVNGIPSERKFDRVSHIFLSPTSNSYLYFAQLPDENQFCVFGRYNGNNCELDAYMNPAIEGDGKGIIYAGTYKGKWSIFRDFRTLISNIGYGQKADISYDYFFFDTSNPRYFAFAEKRGNTYQMNKGGYIHPKQWYAIDMQKVFFGYNNTVFFVGQDEEGWKVVEMN